MKVKLLFGILVVLIVLNLATIGSFIVMQWRADRNDARPWAGRDTRGPGWEERRMHPPFRPTPDERQQLMTLLNEFRLESEALRQKIREDENHAFELMQRQRVPRAQVDSLLEEIAKARLETGRLAVDKLIESKQYLTPQQQKMFFDRILQIRPGEGERRGWHGQMQGRQQRGNRRGDERL